MTDDSLLPFDLPAACRKKMTAAFDGGRLVLGRWGTATARGGAASGHRWPSRRRPSRGWYTGKSLPEADRPEDETGTGGSSSAGRSPRPSADALLGGATPGTWTRS